MISSFRDLYFVLLLAIFGYLTVVSEFSAASSPENRRLVPSDVAAKSPIPLPASGSCFAETGYTIESVDDLFDKVKDLECIFAAGKTPSAVPLGYSYGYLLTAVNTAFFSKLANIAYQGDFTVRTACKGSYHNIGWLSIAGIKPGTALWTIGDGGAAIGVPLRTGEYPLADRDVVVMDFTVNFKALCPVEGAESSLGMKGFSPFLNSVWPLNQFVDLSVVVGIDKNDGGIISLNKAYMQPKDAADGAATVLFYATKSFDPTYAPGFTSPIFVPYGPNGEDEIFYNREAVKAVTNRLDLSRILGDHSQLYSMTLMRESGNPQYQYPPDESENSDIAQAAFDSNNAVTSLFDSFKEKAPAVLMELAADSRSFDEKAASRSATTNDDESSFLSKGRNDGDDPVSELHNLENLFNTSTREGIKAMNQMRSAIISASQN